MSEPERAGTYSSVEARTLLERVAPLLGAVLVLLALLAAATFVTGGGAIWPSAERGGSAEFRREAATVLSRYDALSADVDQLLTEQESNPWAQSDPAWRERYSDALSRARALRDSAAALTPPEADRQVAARLSEGLGLYATGLDLLLTGYGMGGHGAYYYGSHGNWDLNLGAQRLEEARQLLSSS